MVCCGQALNKSKDESCTELLPQHMALHWHFTVFVVNSYSEVCCVLQSANFVRSHWLWRQVAYEGGIIPEEDKYIRKSINPSSKPGQNSTAPHANGSSAYANTNGDYSSS